MSTHEVTISVSGEIVMQIKASSPEKARDVAQKIIDDSYGLVFQTTGLPKKVEEFNEVLDFEIEGVD